MSKNTKNPEAAKVEELPDNALDGAVGAGGDHDKWIDILSVNQSVNRKYEQKPETQNFEEIKVIFKGGSDGKKND